VIIASSSVYSGRLGADCAPRHFIHPNQPHLEKTLVPHHPLYGFTRPVMGDLRQHLIEYDGSKMSETELLQQFEIGDAAEAETK
jgi:hypothetical protein